MVGRWFVSFQNGPFKTRTFVHFQVGGVRLRLWSGCFWVKPQGIMTQASILGGVSHPKFPTINHTTVAWGNFLAGIPGSEMILIKRWKKPPMLPRMNKLVWSQHRIFFRKIFHPINPIRQNLPANPKHKNPNPNPPNPPKPVVETSAFLVHSNTARVVRQRTKVLQLQTSQDFQSRCLVSRWLSFGGPMSLKWYTFGLPPRAPGTKSQMKVYSL